MIHWQDEAKRFGFSSARDLLEEWYSKQKLSTLAIARRLEVSPPTVLKALRKYKIKVRSRGGANHSRWRKMKWLGLA